MECLWGDGVQGLGECCVEVGNTLIGQHHVPHGHDSHALSPSLHECEKPLRNPDRFRPEAVLHSAVRSEGGVIYYSDVFSVAGIVCNIPGAALTERERAPTPPGRQKVSVRPPARPPAAVWTRFPQCQSHGRALG